VMNRSRTLSRRSIVITVVAVVAGGAGVALALSGDESKVVTVPTASTVVGSGSADAVSLASEDSVPADSGVGGAVVPPVGSIGGAGILGDDDDESDHESDHDDDHDRDDDDGHDDDHDGDHHDDEDDD
jgi:hypothetical protein